jgi:site-specific DNA recombinase
MTLKKQAATYCRISYDKRRNEAGVERQQADTDALAKRLGYRVVKRIVDNDRSATRASAGRRRKEREGFAEMLELVAAGSVDAVVVYDLDRWSRNPDELGAWIDAAEANPGVKIITTGDVIDLSDDDAIFRMRILLAVAEKEARNTARRVKREALSAAEKGIPRWTTRPFGFQRDGTHVPAEADELRAIYTDVIAGRSMASIAKDLNSRNIENPSGARWQSSTIGFLVRAARNAGLREYNGKPIGPGTWDEIVPESTWIAAIAALDARKAGRRTAARSLLGGLVRCAGCGGAMCRSARAYRCLPRSDGYETTCGVTIAGDRLDDYVTGLVLTAPALGRVQPTQRNTKLPAVNVNRLHGTVNRLQADLDALAGMFGRGEMSLSEYRAAKHPLDQRLATATAELAHSDARAALERMTGPLATLAERWDQLDVALKARIVGTLIERITVTKANRPGQPFDPARTSIVWRP